MSKNLKVSCLRGVTTESGTRVKGSLREMLTRVKTGGNNSVLVGSDGLPTGARGLQKSVHDRVSSNKVTDDAGAYKARIKAHGVISRHKSNPNRGFLHVVGAINILPAIVSVGLVAGASEVRIINRIGAKVMKRGRRNARIDDNVVDITHLDNLESRKAGATADRAMNTHRARACLP